MTSIHRKIGDIIEKSTDDNTRNCKQDPTRCLWQCCVDAFIFISLFTALSFTIDHRKPDIDSVFVFASIWVPILFLLKAMDLEYSDQLARTAGWSLGQKMFSVLAN